MESPRREMAIGAPSGWHDIWGGSIYNTSVVGIIVDDRNLTDGSGGIWKLLVNGESMAVWYGIVGERRERLHVHARQPHAPSPQLMKLRQGERYPNASTAEGYGDASPGNLVFGYKALEHSYSHAPNSTHASPI